MNLENFKAICSYMLQKHYGIQLVDTHYEFKNCSTKSP